MVILELSSLKPEEIVRQNYIKQLIGEGFSPHLIVQEKKISELPHLLHLNKHQFPNRRIDILCYQKEGDLLIPYLLIECKACPIQESMKKQITGYNFYVKAKTLLLISPFESWQAKFDSSILDYQWLKIG